MAKLTKQQHTDISRERPDQKAAGYFDGRYRTRMVPDKKKKARKNWARKSKPNSEQD